MTMPSTYDILKQNRSEILSLAATHGVVGIRVFGSVARGQEKADSDIDFLVNMGSGRSLFDMAKLQTDLENLLHRQIDLVSEKGIYPKLRAVILREAREF
jgi:uncharacterized protein